MSSTHTMLVTHMMVINTVSVVSIVPVVSMVPVVPVVPMLLLLIVVLMPAPVASNYRHSNELHDSECQCEQLEQAQDPE